MRKIIIFLTLSILTAITCNSQTIQQADSLHERGKVLLGENKIAEGKECTRQAMEIRKKLLGEVNEDYITSLNNYALAIGMEENYAEAIRLQTQVLKLCDKLKTPHKNLGIYTMNLGRFYLITEDYANASKYLDKALPLVEKHSEIYEKMLEWLGLCYTELNDKKNLERIMALVEEHNQHELTLPCDKPDCMIERAQYYAATGETAKAKEHFMKVFKMTMDNATKVKAYDAYATFLFENQEYVSAAENKMVAANAQKSIDGVSEAYAKLLYSSSVYSYLGKQYQQAIDNYLIVVDYYQKIDIAAARSNEAKCWKGIANAYMGLKQYDKAKEYYQRVVAYYEQYDRNSDDYPKALIRLATAEKFNKEYDSSVEHHRQAMAIFEQRGMSEEYADAANSLKLCYAYAGKAMPKEEQQAIDEKQAEAAKAAQTAKLNAIVKEETENLEITRQYLGQLAYARSLNTIAGCYALMDKTPSAIDYYKQYMSNIREAVRNEFGTQSVEERMTTWNHESQSLKEMIEVLLESHGDEKMQQDIGELAYDAALLSKGILLKSSIEFEKVLQESENPELMEQYRQIRTNGTEIDRLRRTASTEAELERIVELMRENQTLQLKLAAGCKEIADFTNYISYDWKSVQKNLNPDDIAIEFISADPLLEGRDDYMVAVMLDKKMKYPTCVILWDNEELSACNEEPYYQQMQDSIIFHCMKMTCNLDVINSMISRLQKTDVGHKRELVLFLRKLATQMAADSTFVPWTSIIGAMQYNQLIDNNHTFDTPEVGDLIWGTLSPYLKGKKRVLFSADGCFNRIGIEYLQYGGIPLSEQYEVYRLSSTKELCYKHTKTSPTIAMLFGDINYNRDATMSGDTKNTLVAMRGSGDAENAIILDNLDNTKREVDEIAATLKSKKIANTNVLRNTEASKEAFLALSDTRVNLIHIASHGLYRDDKRATDAQSMENSLIAFAGANLDETRTSAFVSAAEIASMNLRQCDLVVLSACETGLGKLGDDGVFGLQRGFKNAGVHTLLMSLKNVYDNSTADMMIRFYHHLLNGATKREALVNAQKDIRAMGYTDADHWASFILLDALDQ